mmetsp:Transcript_109189/g.216800  ORF Transcript_109189/g.216800 Transcript_109189/m.216800 type:complete len:242 (+) Transcript_109189:58-783(+)|eukprot:CAMPEP_0172689208 /NCGR_PEP_ID=MMETSP1074-20121228/22983_1 /TAXON_ID=2916 /ORGANISM="Ceratium fusus, Strain PA161109" /LENGTH=241 /DNA_ID=CAMNT_0013508979 /DNA_START=42 /DNA_END=767 /DNA_ORIENTATION=-
MAFAGEAIPELQDVTLVQTRLRGSRVNLKEADAPLQSDGRLKKEGQEEQERQESGCGETLQADGPQTSEGSALHPTDCVPCSFYCYSLRGCIRGIECKFCHMEHRSRCKRGGKKTAAKVKAAAACVQVLQKTSPKTLPNLGKVMGPVNPQTEPRPGQGLPLTKLPAGGGLAESDCGSDPPPPLHPWVTCDAEQANCEDDLRLLIECVVRDRQHGGNGDPYKLILEAGWGLTIKEEPKLVAW